MASLYRLKLDTYINRARAFHPDRRFVIVSAGLSKWLTRTAESLRDLGMPFEASEAESISDEFSEFSKHDGTADGFIAIWVSLTEWSETSVFFESREKTLCYIPALPDAFEC